MKLSEGPLELNLIITSLNVTFQRMDKRNICMPSLIEGIDACPGGASPAVPGENSVAIEELPTSHMGGNVELDPRSNDICLSLAPDEGVDKCECNQIQNRESMSTADQRQENGSRIHETITPHLLTQRSVSEGTQTDPEFIWTCVQRWEGGATQISEITPTIMNDKYTIISQEKTPPRSRYQLQNTPEALNNTDDVTLSPSADVTDPSSLVNDDTERLVRDDEAKRCCGSSDCMLYAICGLFLCPLLGVFAIRYSGATFIS